MTIINKRVGKPQAMIINGVDNGGAMTIAIQEGWENTVRSSPDGLQFPVIDKDTQFCRGVLVTQDLVHIIELLTGTVGTYVFYERTSGVVEGTGYTKHELIKPVIHQVSLRFSQGGYATLSASFECRAASETSTIAEMHVILPGQAAPAYISAVRGGWRIVSAVHGSGPGINIYHLTGFSFSITLPLSKACNDGDIAYTAVDAYINGMTTAGSIEFQDSSVYQSLLVAAPANLVIAVKQSGGGADKVITIANVSYINVGENSDVNAEYTGYTAAFEVANDPAAPLTLAVAPKILTIADA